MLFKNASRPISLLKLFLVLALTMFALQANASHITFSFGIIENPMPVRTVAWIPSHWFNGYWVPGQYVQYNNFQNAPTYMYVDNYVTHVRHHGHRYYYN